MGRRRTTADGHKMTNIEVTRRFHDKAASIDKELDEAIAKIDWQRRNGAERSLVDWVKTYCIGLLLDDEPPERGNEVLQHMQRAVHEHSNFMINMSRGSGKSSYVECTTLYALATGIQKFVVIISNNGRAAAGLMNDIWRMVSEPDTAFAQDYPTLTCPFQLCNGSFRRKQTYHGTSTELSRNASQIVFARLKGNDGKEMPTSGSIITVRGISSGIRGLKKNTLRPSLVILDDLQDAETAENPESVQKLMTIIQKDVMCLGGKQRLSILQTATPICPEDLVERIRSDSNWKTTTFPAILKFPNRMDLWTEYFKKFDAENVADGKHTQSLELYKKNRALMDEGSEVFNPTRFSESDGHISAIQKLLEIKHVIGEAAFASEYQMSPQKYSFQIDVSPKVVVSKVNQYAKGQVPDGYSFVAASTDLNLSYAMSTTIIAYKPDMTACVIDYFLTPSNIDMKCTDTEYNQRVYNQLSELGKKIKSLGYQVNGWGIDASGKPFDAVTSFARNSMMLCGVPACAMLGRASHIFNGFVRSRLRNEVNRTVLCGDQQEHLKQGTGKKYMFWDSDMFREMVHKAFIAEVGAAGSCSLFAADAEQHTEFAIQVCNERLMFVRHGLDGKNHYTWKSAEPHDFLDSCAQNFAIAASQSISGNNISTNGNIRQKLMQKRLGIRRKIRVV